MDRLFIHRTQRWSATPSAQQTSTSVASSLLQPLVRRRHVAAAAQGRSVDSAMSDLRQAMRGGSSSEVDAAHLNASQYLKSIGLNNQAEVARVLDIATNPTSMFISYRDPKRAVNASARPLSVEEDIMPVVDFLLSQGMSEADVVKVITEHPPLLSYSVQERLEPFWLYLGQEVGIADVAAVVAKRPSLLGLDVDKNLRRMVDYLQSVDTPPETIAKYLQTSL